LDETGVLCYLSQTMAKRTKQAPTVGFLALGCAKNTVDSERMLAEIAQAGFLISGEPEELADWNADVVVINTCGFIAPAVAESLEVIRQVAGCKVTGNVGKVVVAGCLAQRYGSELFNMADGIDAVVGLSRRDDIAKIIRQTISARKHCCLVDEPPASVGDDRARLLINPSYWAYLRISEGCDHRCSFCTIPSIRGRFRSKPVEMIISEAQELVSAGVVELNIIGQDTTYYGRDLKSPGALVELLGELDKVDGIEWIRLLYAYPTGINEQVIETIASSRKIVHYLDIPLQHISNRILKAMRRPDTKEKIVKMIGQLRDAMPDIVLRTTLIVGFPGETDRDFKELMDFITEVRFDALGAFRFYPEAGTQAAEMAEQVPEEVKAERLGTLMEAQQEIAFAKGAERVGSQLQCLVDWTDLEKVGVGRYYGQAPEVDGVCSIVNCSATEGQIIDVKVTGSEEYDLVVEQI